MGDAALVYLGVALVSAGIWVGQRAAHAKWMSRGTHGFPRVEHRGVLYWVNRDDRPCFRCGASKDKVRADHKQPGEE